MSESDAISWRNHALIGVSTLGFFLLGLALLPRWLQPAVYTSGYYLFREVEQILNSEQHNWLDRFGDVLAPFIATALVCATLWGIGVRW